jgi:exodeoxyribonuclease VII small subunit
MMSPRAKKASTNEPAYEKAFAELQGIVAKLEDGKTSLEETLILYERGQNLAKLCAKLLDQAELRIRDLGKTPIRDDRE